MKIDIKVSAHMPENLHDEYRQKSICEKAKDYMVVCESDEESEYHWRYLKSLYNKLHKMKELPEKYFELIGELEAFMSKYGQYDSGEGQVKMTGENMFKYRGEA